jgi:succinyl-CoA synthetase beta subunit
VAVKILSDRLAHKTDVGGVVLGVEQDQVAAAAAQVRAAVTAAAPQAGAARILVQSMATGVGEALVGYRVDPQVGPVILLAAGGVATGIYRDRSVRLAPVDVATAHAMIDEVAGFALLKGFRGRPRGDLDALAEAVAAVSRLALHPDWGVTELEVNPLVVREQGVAAVDAMALVAEEGLP